MEQHAKARSVHRKSKKAAATEPESPGVWLRHVGTGVGVGFGVGALLVLIGSLIAYFTADPVAIIRPLAWGAAALSACTGGFVTAKRHRHAALLCGLLHSAVSMALMLLLSLFFKAYASGFSAGVICGLYGGFLACSLIGAYWGVRQKKHSKRRTRQTS